MQKNLNKTERMMAELMADESARHVSDDNLTNIPYILAKAMVKGASNTEIIGIFAERFEQERLARAAAGPILGQFLKGSGSAFKQKPVDVPTGAANRNSIDNSGDDGIALYTPPPSTYDARADVIASQRGDQSAVRRLMRGATTTDSIPVTLGGPGGSK